MTKINHLRPQLKLKDNLRKFQEQLNREPLPEYAPIVSYETPYPKVLEIIQIIGSYYESYLDWLDFIEKDISNLKSKKSEDLIIIRDYFYEQIRKKFRIIIFYAAKEMQTDGSVSKAQKNFLKVFLKSIQELDEVQSAFQEELENAGMQGL